VVETITGLPDGALGFRVTGHLVRSDYTDVMLPPVREVIARGERVRILIQIDPGFTGLDPSAAWEDLKSGLELEVGHHDAWERFALVTDAAWVGHLVSLAGWMVPGEIRVFPHSELGAATAWLTPG
jgi:hypothetical protein